MYQAIILDMDGTIIDSVPAIERTLRETGAKWGIAITNEMADAAKYSTNKQLCALLGANGANGVAEPADFIKDWENRYHEAAKETPLFPGMEKVIKAPLRRAIVTSETEKELLWNLNRLGFSPSLFECLAGADTTEYAKPHPGPLLYCLSQMGINPEDALFVGDSLNDMKCAAAAGVSFALARFGEGESAGPAELAAMGYTNVRYILKRPEEILELV